MTDCSTLKKQAEAMFKQNQFTETAAIYEQVKAECGDQWDEWAVWYYVRALRKLKRSHDGIATCQAFRKINPNSGRVNGQFGWCLYDIMKDAGKEDNAAEFFKAANEAVRVNVQEDYSPYEWIVFAVLDYLHDQANPSYTQLINWSDKLDPSKLSTEAKPALASDEHNKSYPSERERWYGIRTKALIEVGRYKDCISICNQALSDFTLFHYDNDVWFEWRRGIAYLNLDQPEAALADFKRVHKRKKDYFVEQAIARTLFALNQNEQALAHAVNGALIGGKIEFKWKLFMLMAQILAALGETDYARQHILLAVQARAISNPSKDSPELNELLGKLQVDPSIAPPINKLLRDLKSVWQSINIPPETTHKGAIEQIHGNGKSGNIRAVDGTKYFFGMRNYKGSPNNIQPGQRIGFNLEETLNNKTGATELHAVDIVPLD